jgi:parallel beta-helix repeat protein
MERTGQAAPAFTVICSLIAALFLAPWTAWAGGTYYVATTGSDANPGTESLPWRTIQKAANTLAAGDTAYIRAGTYSEPISPQNSGTEGSFITYANYPGEVATIDGTGVDIPEWAGLFDITNRVYIRVSGLRIVNACTNPHNPGILVDTCEHIWIEKNYTHNTNDSGIGVWSSSDVLVEGNEVDTACQAMWNECISVGGSARFEVRNNVVHDSEKEGICVKDGSSKGAVYDNEVYGTGAVGFYVDAQDERTSDIQVHNNVSHDGAENGFAMASEVGGLLENVRVYNNVAYGNGWCGLQVTACCIGTHPMSGIQIVNNTFYDNGRGEWGGGIYLENDQAEGVVVRNNLCSQNLTFQIAADPGTYESVDHNLVDGFRGSEGEIRGDACVEGDPLFVEASSHDFHLRFDSPAIAMGSPDAAPWLDFDYQPRGTPPDIGADEYYVGECEGCTLSVPDTARVAEQVPFNASCLPGWPVDWDFGDGTAHSPEPNPVHAYSSEGAYHWVFSATDAGQPCRTTGTIHIKPPPPEIAGVAKEGSPFRLKVTGAHFQYGIRVYIAGDSSLWNNYVRKSEVLIVLKGGSALKARFPRGQAVSIRVVNPNGGEATTTYTRP